MAFQIPTFRTCSFCEDLFGSRASAFIVQNEDAAALVNERQYERGAALVIPRTHRESILDITDGEIAAVYSLAKRVGQAAATALGATGMNVFQNNGIHAGQSQAHFHVHVVPRYPTSDPARRFREAEFPVLSLEEQHAVAAIIKTGLEPTNA